MTIIYCLISLLVGVVIGAFCAMWLAAGRFTDAIKDAKNVIGYNFDKVQFIEPITFSEKFKNAKNIDDMMKHE